MNQPIYLDYAATTPVDPIVAEKMMQYLTLDGVFANPASRSHRLGWQAEEAVEDARIQVAELINADSREIVWTSGATEANNLAIKGVADNHKGGHIISSQIEHKAVLDPLKELEKSGFEVTFLKPEPHTGIITAEAVKAALRKDTILVSTMYVNNEIGTINDISAIGKVIAETNEARDNKILFHVDGAQAIGKIPVGVQNLPVDLMSLSAHKVYGPKGIGALYVRRHPSVKVQAQIHGGGHERGMRSGTLATHQIVGMGAAFELAKEKFDADTQHIQSLSDTFLTAMLQMQGIRLNGDANQRISNIMNVCFEGVENEALMMALPDLAVSSGSACNSKTVAPSYVLQCIGLTDNDAHSSLRFSIGRFSTENEIDHAITSITDTLKRLK